MILTAGKFSYRRLAVCAWREANRRSFALPQDVGRGLITMAEADDEIAMMRDIADILDWLADREIEAKAEYEAIARHLLGLKLTDDGEPGW
jgi:hypothetical protein